MKKWWLTFVMVMAVVFSVAACSGSDSGADAVGQDNNKPADNGGESPSVDAQNADDNGFVNGKYDPPITLTTVLDIQPDLAYFKDGETMEDNVMHRIVKERLGIEIKYDWLVTNTNDAYKTKLRLMLSSGEKMPDIVRFRGDKETVNMLIDSGQFMPVDELIEQYAGDIYKSALEEYPALWYPYMRDGKKMALPIFDYAHNGDQTLVIRDDWLKKLNLKAPTTMEELEQVMDAFVNGDPDGNGEKDTIALATGFKNGFRTWMGGLGFVFGAYGVIPSSWNPGADGKLYQGSVDPRGKEALVKLNEWMEKGYISQDSALKDEFGATEFFISGKAGIIVGPHWMIGWPLPDVLANDPDAVWSAYPLPAGPDGTRLMHGNEIPVNGVIFVNKDAEHPEAILHYYNFFFDNFGNPGFDSEFANGVAEGYDYALLDNGTVVVDPEIAKEHPELFPGVDVSGGRMALPLFYTLTYEGARIPSLYAARYVKIASGGTPETPSEQILKDLYDTNRFAEMEVNMMKVVMDQIDIYQPNYYTGPLTETMQSKNELLNKLVNEAYNKIVYGQAPIGEFDKMVTNWMNSGGAQITEEVNAWYDEVK